MILALFTKVFLFNLFRIFGWPKLMPVNFTIGLSYQCNSRCQTCRIWKSKNHSQLSLNDYEKIFKNIGASAYEVILTGGEPFLREEIAEICHLIARYLKPKIIIVPTNGLFPDLIFSKTRQILEKCPRTKMVVNLSMDGIGKKNDLIRGVSGSFDRAQQTFQALRKIKNKNFDLKIHTVISKFNVGRIPEIHRYIASQLMPDAHILEIAEERVELGNIGSGIAPDTPSYAKAADFLAKEIKNQKMSGLSKITQAFRLEYYNLVKELLLKKRQIIPCFAAMASCQITPDGEVWVCCIKGESIGNLKDNEYNFRKIWRSQKAKDLRRAIKQRKCFCPLANVSYTNMFCHPPTLLKVILSSILRLHA